MTCKIKSPGPGIQRSCSLDLKLSGLNQVNFNHPGYLFPHVKKKKKNKGICIPQLLKSLSNLVETVSQTLAQVLLIGGFSDAYIMANEGFSKLPKGKCKYLAL